MNKGVKIGKHTKDQIEEARRKWAKVAGSHDWHTDPFYIQAWVNEDGDVIDAVAFKGMTEDIILESDGDFD